jgi:hypothetical protein
MEVLASPPSRQWTTVLRPVAMTPTSNDNASHSSAQLRLSPSPAGAYAMASACFRFPGPREVSDNAGAMAPRSTSMASMPLVSTAPKLPPLTLATNDTALLPMPQLKRRFRRKPSIVQATAQSMSQGEQDPFATPCHRVSYWMPPAVPLEGTLPLLRSVSATSPRLSVTLPPSPHLPNLEEDLEHQQGRGTVPWHGNISLRHRMRRTCVLQP